LTTRRQATAVALSSRYHHESSYAKINPGVEVIFNLFEQPRHCTDDADFVAQANCMPRLKPSFLGELARPDIIIRVAA
jgi:hypothetical protein